MTTPDDPTPPGPQLPGPPPQWPYQPPPTHAAPSWPDPPSKKMAGWALGLAIVPCCGGVTTLVGIGLAIAVLVRSRHGVNHGKGMAISALVIGALWIVAGITVVVLGVLDGLTGDADRDESGQVAERSDQSMLKIRVGDCFDYPPLFEGDEAEGLTVEAVPCAEPHQFEAYKVFDLPDGDYPGVEEVDRMAAEACVSAFRGFVGTSVARSALEPYYFIPQANGWRLLDDHAVVCFVGAPGELTTGTLENSRR